MKHKTNIKIIQAQQTSGLTVKAFCVKMNISQQYYYQIKREKVEVSNSCLDKYVKVLKNDVK